MDWLYRIEVAAEEGVTLMGLMLHHVPDTVWAALIAAGVAFLTTTLSNRNSRKQLQMQLTHNAGQQKQEREMALRRDVYLPVIEAIARAHGALGQLIDLDMEVTAISGSMIDDVATMAKAHLIASEGTVRGLLAFQKALMPAYFELMSLRMPLDVRQSAIAAERNYMDKATADHQKFIQLLQQLHLSGSQDKAAVERVNSQLEGAENSFRRHAERQAALHQEQVSGQLAAAERLSELAQIVSKCMPETLIAARQELELPIDPVEYRRLYVEQQDAITQATREFLEKLRNQSGTAKRD